jgi:MFS transporter, DHA2 family, multidrug resistance protein
MVRTIGGSIGIAILVAMVSSHSQMHQTYLTQQIDPFRFGIWRNSYPAAAGQMADITRHGAAPLLGMVYQEVQRQASVLAFVDDFRLIAYIFFFLTPLAFVMRRQKSIGPAPSAH